MKVSAEKPFEIIYSLFQHQYLGYLFESFAVQLDAKKRLSFVNQNISTLNASEFRKKLDERDFELIKVMDSMQQDAVVKHFIKKKIKAEDFFLRVFDKQKGDRELQYEIAGYVERRRSAICPLLKGKRVFEMGKDGEPTWKELTIAQEEATVLFHFYRNEKNTHYFPTIKLFGSKVDIYQNGSYLLGEEPGCIVANDTLFFFEKNVSGKKIKPFFAKKFIEVPRSVEETYYKKFIAPIIGSYDVYAKGFKIETISVELEPTLTFSEITNSKSSLFDENQEVSTEKILFELYFHYHEKKFKADKLEPVGVAVHKLNDSYKFQRIIRDIEAERHILQAFSASGLVLKNAKASVNKPWAFDWLYQNSQKFKEMGVLIKQNGDSKYFMGKATIDIEISEGMDWFDIKSKIFFGKYEIPFAVIRRHIIQGKYELILPDESIALIPETWITEYADLFSFSEEFEKQPKLKKIHFSLVKTLQSGEHTRVAISRKLEKLTDFEKIEAYPLPENFNGTLRNYQKAGYDWMKFLDHYNFGGCLADDMGLGKTVQTLSLLQSEKEQNPETTSLLVMPTSLIYNWMMEAGKFAPKLKIFNYTGTNRNKNIKQFARYDLIITSYGIARIDTLLIKEFYFNYIILDESQVIKNPDSGVAQSVKKLKSRRRLILTGTPIENSTMDLWSQMSFINPGLLGDRKYFQKEFQVPIEKKQDMSKTDKLNRLVKPFLLRREKSQVAQDLPEKIEKIQYCQMSDTQREFYESEKSAFKNKIFDILEQGGAQKSHLILIQGLTRLRQIANHPLMVDGMYSGDSGKFEDITYMIQNALGDNHKLLIFSQFVKHLSLIRNYLNHEKISFAYLDGSTKDRHREVEKFQQDNETNTFLISLKAGGLGLNLTSADYVFILDPWWNPAAEAQAVDRAHRIGQKQTVFNYKFIARDTVEEKILKLQKSKLKLAGDIVTIEDQFIKTLSSDDISGLLD